MSRFYWQGICLGLLMSVRLAAGTFVYPDFDTAMLRGTGCIRPEQFEKDIRKYKTTNPKYLKLFREMYEQNVLELQETEQTDVRIPLIVHQIWLGSPVPEKFHCWMASWAALQGWEYRLWTDEEVRHLHLYNQDLYDHAENYGEKSDILRLEILDRYGGVYADVDFECVRPDMFEELHRSFDFYIGFEPIEHGYIHKFNMFKMCNAIIAAMPHHPLINDMIVNMKANYLAYKQHAGAFARTGPSYLTRIICEYEKSHAHMHRNMYFPCTFFYPISKPEMETYSEDSQVSVPIFPETAGIHYWTGSWLKNTYYIKKQ